ncbi:hypothetical protein [Okeania sp. SIO2C2]|uniref:hypothetical protein n=1 Tax=Okeania sp. SIO2C2 TaxID=2607787 RepID=UPI00257D98AB|nr:hypothetical protein [Okeania sp. SIO2C2]
MLQIDVRNVGSIIFHDFDYYLEALRSPEITLWSAWEGDELLGCGALKELDSITGQVKSIRTAKAHQLRGKEKLLPMFPVPCYINLSQSI